MTDSRRTTAGHEVPLASMIKNRRVAEVETISGKVFHGLVQGFDKYTVTLNPYGEPLKGEASDCHKKPKTIFKHSIESFNQAGH